MRDITIQGVTFSAPTPYATGHVLTEIEANVLNQTYTENLRNNFAPQVKEAKEAGTFDEASFATKFAEYAASYTFGATGGTRGPRGPQDPVGVVALNLAEADVLAGAARKGLKLPKAKITELAKKLCEAKSDHYRAIAEKQLAKAGKEDADLDSLFA